MMVQDCIRHESGGVQPRESRARADLGDISSRALKQPVRGPPGGGGGVQGSDGLVQSDIDAEASCQPVADCKSMVIPFPQAYMNVELRIGREPQTPSESPWRLPLDTSAQL